MAYFVKGFPYSNTHDLNLDWVIDTLKRIEAEIGQIQDGLEIHVTDTNGVEIYTFTVKANGIYITRADSGTPFFYNYDTQTLHAPYFDGQSFLFASGRTTGQFRAGSLVLDNALPIAQGGTGATTAAAARTAIGAQEALSVTTGSPTWHNSITASDVVLEKYGKVVVFNSNFTVTTQIGTYQNLCTLPDGFKPRESAYNTFMWATGAANPLRIYTGSNENGNIKNRDALSAGTYFMTLVFMTP